MTDVNQWLVGVALILGAGTLAGIVGAILDLPGPITAILGGCAAVLAVHFGLMG